MTVKEMLYHVSSPNDMIIRVYEKIDPAKNVQCMLAQIKLYESWGSDNDKNRLMLLADAILNATVENVGVDSSPDNDDDAVLAICASLTE